MKEALSLVQRLSAHPDSRCWFVSWSPNGTLFASCGGDKAIRIWGREGAAGIKKGTNEEMVKDCGAQEEGGGGADQCRTPRSETGTNPGDGAPFQRIKGALKAASQVSSGCYSFLYLQKHAGDTWICKSVLEDGHQRAVRKVAWSPCGNYLASASFDATTCIWKKKNDDFESLTVLEGHENEVKCVAWAPSGNLLATCSRDKSVWVWEVDEEDEYECVTVVNSHTQDVKHVVWHPTLELLASASYDNNICIYKEDDDDWECRVTLQGHTSTVWGLAFDGTGKRLASCSDDRTVKIWKDCSPEDGQGDLSWKCVCTLSGYHGRTVYDISWCRLSGALATACGDDGVRIFREDETADPEQPVFSLAAQVTKAHDQDVNCVAWNPKEAGLLASCSDNGEIAIWRFQES